MNDGKGIAGATISFIPATRKKDTIVSSSDDRGILITRSLTKGETYQVTISSVGYKPFTGLYKNTDGALSVFSMEREIVNCSPVVVIGYGSIRCKRISCCGLVTKPTNCTIRKETSFGNPDNPGVVYPNPVEKGSNVTVALNQIAEQTVIIKVLNLNGQVLSSKAQRPAKGPNRFYVNIDLRWAAGVYFIQVTGTDGSVLKLEKIIVR